MSVIMLVHTFCFVACTEMSALYFTGVIATYKYKSVSERKSMCEFVIYCQGHSHY